jgi:uncharacterized protein
MLTMKFLVVVLVLAIAFFAWRSGRKEQRSAERVQPRKPQAIAQDMVACAHCGVHLPLEDAVHGRRAVYCGTEHLQHAGDSPR